MVGALGGLVIVTGALAAALPPAGARFARAYEPAATQAGR